MTKLVLLGLFTTSLLGCASQEHFVGYGAEALVHTEQHSFEFVITKRVESSKQLNAWIQDIESMDREAVYVVDYRSTASKQMLQNIFEQYPSHVIAPLRVSYRSAQLLPSDLKIQATLTRLTTQPCTPANIHLGLLQLDCFAESMRLKQVAYKSRLLGGQ
ncbi:hypothetical protein [Vibrio sp. Vb339]|uniref:hypothetical protein n=1 Tax=Vibrio sp. Vb339 TaxID=1192013 RepID=UPI001555CFBA|nr:hypothetical protein [Vibrio sp. Vb339]